jgi:hypothetical protein
MNGRSNRLKLTEKGFGGWETPRFTTVKVVREFFG